MDSIFSDSPLRTRYALQGETPFLWGSRLRICYTPNNYTPTPTTGTSELDEHLGAHLAGIDAALAGVVATDNLVTISGDNLTTISGDNLVEI